MKPRTTRHIQPKPKVEKPPPPKEGRGPHFSFRLYPDDEYYPQLMLWLDSGYSVRDIFDALMDAYTGKPPVKENLSVRTLEVLGETVKTLQETVERLAAGGFASGIPGGLFIQQTGQAQQPVEEIPLPDSFFGQLADVGGTAFFDQ